MSPDELTEEELQRHYEEQDAAFEAFRNDPKTRQMTLYAGETLYQRLRELAYRWDTSKSQVLHMVAIQGLDALNRSHLEQTGRPLFDDGAS